MRLLKNYFRGFQPAFPKRRINNLRGALKSEGGVWRTFSTVSFPFELTACRARIRKKVSSFQAAKSGHLQVWEQALLTSAAVVRFRFGIRRRSGCIPFFTHSISRFPDCYSPTCVKSRSNNGPQFGRPLACDIVSDLTWPFEEADASDRFGQACPTSCFQNWNR